MDIPSFKEDHISQVPALELLQKLGYEYLSPAEAVELRGGRLGGVILDSVLAEQLRKINTIRFKGREYPFSEGNILAAVQAIKDVADEGSGGLIQTNEKIYDLLTLGKAMQQSIDGDTKSFQLDYIDWQRPENNVYHVTEEFAVERSGSHETRRPDVVLLVNGIPLVVIECKRPDLKDPIGQAVSQHIRNQQRDQIPRLFHYAQLLLAVSKNEAKYATIAYRTKRTIHDRMQQDPAFYRRFSEMLEDAIRAFREQRLSDAEYLRKVTEIAEKVKNRTGDDIPDSLAHREVAKAFFGVLQDVFAGYGDDGFDARAASTDASVAIDDIIQQNRIVNWTNNADVQNRMMSAIEDHLFELKKQRRVELTFEDIDRILEMVLDIARTRYA